MTAFEVLTVPEIYCQCKSKCFTNREEDGQYTVTCSDSTCPRYGEDYVIYVLTQTILLDRYVKPEEIETNGAAV